MMIITPIPYIIGIIIALLCAFILYSCLSKEYRSPLYWLVVILFASIPSFNLGIGIAGILFMIIVRKRVHEHSRSKLVRWLFKSNQKVTPENK